MRKDSYILLTATRNEEDYIEETINSVVSQTILPCKWLIISDGSTDKTEYIVRKYVEHFDFIELLSLTGDYKRNFGSKAKSLRYGYSHLRDLECSYIGNLDADVSFGPNYYETILCEFENNKRLGIAGGVRLDLCNGRFIKTVSSRNSVCGAIQLFRKQCFESIGGYMPLEYGGLDAVAEVAARMNGWEVESFPDIEVYHHRPTGSASGNYLSTRLRYGKKFYAIGYHPVFFVAMIFRRIVLSPSFFWGGFLEIFGYLWTGVCNYQRPVSDEFIRYLRYEQICRIKQVFIKNYFKNNIVWVVLCLIYL